MGHPLSDIRLILHKLENICEEMARENGIEHLAGPQGHVLMFLSRKDKQEIFVKDIEQELKISKSVASNLVKRMVKNGFIEIVPSVSDRRYKQVLLTDLGREKIQPLTTFHEEMRQSIFKGISSQDFAVVHQVLHQLTENITAYTGGKDA